MKHPIVHIEISSKDHQASAAWYKEIFGWETQEFPDMNYSSWAGPDESVGGGFNPISDDNPAGTITFYIHTDDLAASVAKVKEKGGEILVDSFDIPGVGTMASFKDPSGNMVSLLQPAPEADM